MDQHVGELLTLQLENFSVPWECTLSELAEHLGVDKSTASETVRRGTARLVEQFFADLD